MKIEKIEIKGLFGKKDICWELNPQVNVLVGENGTGKSTILSVIHNFLIQNIPDKIEEVIHSAVMTFPSGRIDLKIKGKQSKEEVLNDLYKQLGKEKVEAYFKDNSEVFEMLIETLDLQDRLDKGIFSYSANGQISTYIYHRDKYFYIDFIEANTSNVNANAKWDLRTRSDNTPLDIEIQDTIDGLNKLNNFELINRLSGSLNFFFNKIGKHISYENQEFVYTDTELNKPLNYSGLSSGERQLIYILLRVALSNGEKNKTAIILMDEPEISLHLNWQAHFIKQITLLNPDAQFIIVTHSPALIMNGWNDVYVNMKDITQ